MTNNIKIGEVSFNKKDIAKTEKTQKDGQTINTVFLKDGTKLSYPEQNPENNANVSVFDKTDIQVFYSGDQEVYTEMSNGKFEVHFTKLDSAEITGTKNEDHYRLKGCKDSKIDISQNDGKADKVQMLDDPSVFGKVRKSSGNEVSFGKGDIVETPKRDVAKWYQSKTTTHRSKGENNYIKED